MYFLENLKHRTISIWFTACNSGIHVSSFLDVNWELFWQPSLSLYHDLLGWHSEFVWLMTVWFIANTILMCKVRMDEVRFEVCTAAKMQVEVFWDVVLCVIAVGYHSFRGPFSLHLQGDMNVARKRVIDGVEEYG
jgi:uncharacterized membrane protein (UPF0182 family)